MGLGVDNPAFSAKHHTMFDDSIFYNPNPSPHPRVASSKSRLGLEDAPSKPESRSAMSSRMEKRKANTLAARRYRQNRLEKIAELDSALKATQLERDALKVQVAKLDGENQVLRKIIGESMKTC